MEKRIKLLPVIVVLTVLCTGRPYPKALAAVAPVDHSQELFLTIRPSKKAVPARPGKQLVSEARFDAVLIEGHKKTRIRKVFSAAQFVCGLPIDGGTFTTLCKVPGDAQAAVKRMKEQGYDEISLKTPATGEMYDAIVKSARELDMRINA